MNAVRTILYSLKRGKNDQSILTIDLTAKIVAETSDSITLTFPHKAGIVLNKYDWVNKDKIYDDGTVFFMVCNKQRNVDYVQTLLANYAIEKVHDKIEYLFGSRDTIENAEDRIDYLFNFKKSLKSLVKVYHFSAA